MPISEELQHHLDTGLTTLARCWLVERVDGVRLGFTDHDLDLAFDGMDFRADSGMSAKALEQSSGLAVDNTEAMGALSSAAVSEADIEAGRFDDARVQAWLVNWEDTAQRVKQFDGTMGEITRSNGAFHAELRGLTEALNQPQGRIYQSPCSAVLGDQQCGFAFDQPGYAADIAVELVEQQRLFRFENLIGYDPQWFERGRLRVLDGEAQGLIGLIKSDRSDEQFRTLELWDSIRAPIAPGDRIRLEAGCDKRPDTCRLKFNNFLNFRGFPHIPGEDWLMAHPATAGTNDGGRLSE